MFAVLRSCTAFSGGGGGLFSDPVRLFYGLIVDDNLYVYSLEAKDEIFKNKTPNCGWDMNTLVTN
jgi:hypothetical protein